ncbi:MAG: class I SAM-dependent methyltransferase [Ferruginibacter sp.]
MKDNFSARSEKYAKYRPSYPQELFDYILGFVPVRKHAWDCGTGNGQTAAVLADYFISVFATDISSQQINNAVKKRNITYAIEPAENSSLEAGAVNLVCISQALHWFHLDDFYKEVRRVAAPGAVIAAWTYNLLKIDNFTDAYIYEFYEHTLKDYWDGERSYVDEGYKNIPFPFESIPSPAFCIKLKWTVEELEGFLDTWSAVQKFITENNYNPVPHLMDKIKKRWPANENRMITFTVQLKLAYINTPSTL